MTATEQVILVDENDNPTGTAEKMAAHRDALCHRAFSVFVFRQQELLLQQRAAHKYHSPDLWTNTCCSHPRPGEDILQAGQRRLREEMGIEAGLKSAGRFHYIAHFDNGLTENEVDHVLIGFISDETFQINPEEVQDYRFVSLAELKQEIERSPEKFTPWLSQAIGVVEKSLG
ncbi:MAG: isopentenyl-diphosphate Delta-isomerase [Gammaproteobacteria bacterium]